MATTDVTTMAAPVLDQVDVPGAGAQAGRSISLGVSCELMKNQLPGVDIEATSDSAVVQDASGQPMLFTIGSDKHLRLLAAESATATGFTATDLLAGFDGYSEATAFDVSQDLSGSITLAVALTRQDGSGTDLLIAPMLSDDPAKTDWSKFYTLAPKVDGIDPAFVASKIQIGSSDGGNAPFTIAIGAIGDQDFYYRIDGPVGPAQKLEFPENVPSGGAGVSMSIGFAFGDRATWFLYTAGENVTLEATTTAPAGAGKSLTYDYSPGYETIPATLNYNCVATPTGSDSSSFSISSDVYVGTDTGVYMFHGASAKSLSTITDELKDVHQLVVTQDAASISVWALCSPNELYYIYGKKGPAYTWNAPILFNPNAIHIAPMRNQVLEANELFVVNQDESVTHHWQDPGSTLWQQRTLSVPKSNYVFDATTFTTTIHVEDDAGNPLAGTALAVTASEWFYATANGLVYSIDVDNAASIPTDATGTVTLIAMAPDIAPPIFHVTASIFDKVVNVYPNGGVQKGLAAIESGDDLKNARTADGTSVVDPTMASTTLDGVAANVSKMTAAGAGEAPGLGVGDNTFVVVEDSAKHTGTLAAMALPPGVAIGMTVQNGVWQAHPQPAALMASFARLDDILSWPGDALHWLENAWDDAVDYIGQGVTFLQDGASFVLSTVEDGLEIALSFGSKLLKIALKTLGAVFKALNWVLKLIGIDLKKILEWLGHLFGWDDIWDTHKVVATMMRTGIDYATSRAVAEIESVRQRVAGTFATAKQQLDAWAPDPGEADVRPKEVDTQQRSSPASHSSRSAPGTFSQYHMQHSGMLDGVAAFSGELPQGLDDFLESHVLPLVDVLISDLGKDVADLEKLCTDPSNTVADAKRLAVDLADTFLDPVAQITDGLFEFVEALVGLVKSALEDEIEIPFLTEFYEFITDLLGDEEDFTVVNGVALLISIPLVEMWKAGTGDVPFADGNHGLDSPTLFDQIGGSSPAAPMAVRSLVATNDEPAAAADPGTEISQVDKDYARWGTGIGAIAGMAIAVCEIITFASSEDVQEDGKGMSTADKVGLGLNTVRLAGTFPVPVKPHDDAWDLRVTCWTLTGVELIVTPFLGTPQLKGGLNGIVDFVIFILGLTADGLEGADPLVWGADIISGVSGPLRGLGALEVPYAMPGGVAGGLIGAFLGFTGALTSPSVGTTQRLVNPGG